jgi:hypothetical protein
MPALAPYIPPKQNDYDLWLANFAALTTANPPLYGLTAGDAVIIANAYADWHAAFLLATAPGTKTKVTVAAKDVERILSQDTVRPFAIQISLNAGVLASDKIDLGVNPRTSVPAPILAPNSAPDVSVQSAIALTLFMRFRDPLTSPKVKAKPYGVTRCQLFGLTSAVQIYDPLDLAWVKDATKSPFKLDFDAAAAGKRFYFAGRWVVRSGLASPFSSISDFVIP